MVNPVMDFADFFSNGMKRDLPVIDCAITNVDAVVINLGAGDSPLPDATNLDLPKWRAIDGLERWDDESVDEIHAYHFLEHLEPSLMIFILSEVERVLRTGGVFNIVVPYAKADIAFQDPTHRTFFTEETWRTILENNYYLMPGHEREWRLKIGFNLIAGIVGRNLSVFTQLIKES
jgi:SAM-dependent methyltransferase